MKKIFFSILVLSFLTIGIGPTGILSGSYGVKVLAQDSDLPAASGVELPSPGIVPDSPFYFLKSWKESIQTFFTFGAENKAKQFLHLAEVRLAEYQKMTEKGTLRQGFGGELSRTAQGKKLEIAEKTLEKYEKQLNQALEKAEEAKEKGKDVEKLKKAISEKIIKHQEVLIGVLEKVPDEAKKGIENAIEMSQKGFENAIQAVTGEKKKELERKAEEVKSQLEEKKVAGPTVPVPQETVKPKPTEPAVCIQVITPAIGPGNVCKEFSTPCDVPTDWKKVDRCPQPTVAPLPVPVSTPAPAQAPIPIPVPAKTSAPASLVACCNASGGCKLVDTKETCLGMSGKPMSISSCSPNPCSQPTPVYNECKQGPMKDYKCPSGTLVKWQCDCTAQADGEETRFCSVKPSESCPTSAAPLTITGIGVRHFLWMTKEWTVIENIFWTTNIPTTSYVEYGPTTSYGFTTPPSRYSPITDHVAEAMSVLEGTGQPFERNTTYHFRIIAEDTKGNKIVSDDYTFTTGL